MAVIAIVAGCLALTLSLGKGRSGRQAVTLAPQAASAPQGAHASGPLPAIGLASGASPAAVLPPGSRPNRNAAEVERFDALAKSDSSRDRFEAYRLALTCLNEAEFDRVAGSNYIRQCALQPGQWGNADLRHKLIAPAALDGIAGAWWALREEGPGGRFQSIPESPQYRELMAQAYAAALANADPFALAHEAELQSAQGNVARALTLNVASGASLARMNRLEYDPAKDLNLDLDRDRALLGPERAGQAITDGMTLALKLKQ